MAAQKIIESALQRFSRQGYDSTALSEIAADVGIRKPSIYSHFKSKSELFLALLEEAFQREKTCANALSSGREQAEEALKMYVLQTLERYDTDLYLHFWLRAIYLPPPDMEQEIRVYDRQYARLLDAAIHKVLRNSRDKRRAALPLTVLTDAFTGILRGIHAELLYNGRENAESKALAMWNVFELALKTEIPEVQKT